MSEAINKEAIKELVSLGRAAAEVRRVGNTDFVIIPNDHKVVGLADYADNPRADRPLRAKGTIKVYDSTSFCEYHRLFSDDNSRVFADEEQATVLAVLDYHGAMAGGAPRWGEHRVSLTHRLSKEWKEWTAQDGKRTPQLEFGEFIEDHAPDIVEPDGATMLEVARDLRAKTEGDFGSAIRVSNGSVQFKYTEQTKGNFGASNMDIPEEFIVSIPVYLGCDRVRVRARLRYRINSGKLTFWFDLLRADAIKREAFSAARNSIAETLSITIINGTPA